MSHHLNTILYAVSGTGNTYRVGQWIKQTVEANSGQADLRLIDQVDFATPLDKERLRSCTTLGILFPAHGFMPPWSMIKFLFQLPRGKGQTAFCTATRGALKAGPIQIPGIAGLGTFFTCLLLFLKGYGIQGMFSLDMPSNFINFHWGLHPDNVRIISDKAREKLNPYMMRLINGQTVFITLNNLWEAFWSVVILSFMPVFPILYLLVGKLFMAKLMFYNSACNGCGICAKFCPNHGIQLMGKGKQQRPFWTLHCETCLRCMGYCPQKAIEAGHSWGAVLIWLTSLPILTTIPGMILHTLNTPAWLLAVSDSFPVETLVTIVIMLIAYRLFWQLNRISWINRLFTLTTLTRYYRRYHEPATRLKQMKPGRFDRSV